MSIEDGKEQELKHQNQDKSIVSFVDLETMVALSMFKSEVEITEKKDITVEFIDAAPLTAEIHYEDNDSNIIIYQRDEMHTNSTIELQAIVKDGKVNTEGDEETAQIAYHVAEGINMYLAQQGLLEEYSDLDFDTKGVLFSVLGDGEITSRIVEGKNRPNLLCTVLFGAPRMTRPYMNEISSQFVLNSLDTDQIVDMAETGDKDAMEHLAMAYLNGDDNIQPNPEKAYYWLVKCAESGDSQAMFNAGLFKAKGFGTDRNFEKASEWMRKAADAGDIDAVKLAEEYSKLVDAEKNAQNGDAQAQADLAAGLMQLGGSLEQAGAEKDYKESVKWAEKAIDQGNVDGYWTLALAYHHGRGVDVDMDRALELYKKGAEKGNAPCMHNLGCEYLNGINVKKDARKGFELIKDAAEKGNGLAMRDLGKCYQFANGTTGNMKKAVEWYEKALELIDDVELAQKVEAFKHLSEIDPEFSEDYPEMVDDGENETTVRKKDEEKQEKVLDTKEKTTEEVLENVRNGEGTIKQIITLPDGTKKEMAIWGGYELDGYDRTLNIFMYQKDLVTFAKLLLDNEDAAADSISDPCKEDKGYQITVDFIDHAITSILRKGEGRISVESFVRDEKKSCQDAIEEYTGEEQVEENGLFKVNADKIKEKKHQIFALSFLGIRNYLLKEGIVQKLYDMYDESAGVLVKSNEEGKITAKIVKGSSRPDLPCYVFLFGEQLGRPYIDEMLGLKSLGIRPSKNSASPTSVDNDKKQTNKSKELSQGSSNQNDNKKEIENDSSCHFVNEKEEKLHREMDQWEREKNRLNKEKDERKRLREDEINKETLERKAVIEKDYNRRIVEVNEELESLKDIISELEGQIVGLKGFATLKKGKLKKELEEKNNLKNECEKKISNINTEYTDAIKQVDIDTANKIKGLTQELDRLYAIPASPLEKSQFRDKVISIVNSNVGSIITFGEYLKKPIKWVVLRNDSKGVLLYSIKALNQKIYAPDGKKVQWVDSEMRKWLNNEFYSAAFSQMEKSVIMQNNCDNTEEVNPGIRDEGFEENFDTLDYVFLLSKSEYKEMVYRKKELETPECWLRTAFTWYQFTSSKYPYAFYVDEDCRIGHAYGVNALNVKPCIVIDKTMKNL